LTKQDDGTARLDTSMQPLHATTKKPVGTPLVQTGTVVMSDGTFALHQPGDVLGDANPITGADISFDVTLSGVIRSANRYCGDASGMVPKPTTLDLTGSKFAAVRVNPGDPLPPPDVSCKVEEPMPDMATTEVDASQPVVDGGTPVDGDSPDL